MCLLWGWKSQLIQDHPKYKLIEDISLLCMRLLLSIFLQRYIAFIFKKSCQKQKIKYTVLLVLWFEQKTFPIHSCIWTVVADDWWGSGGSSALLEEVCLWGWALKFYSLAPFLLFLFSATWGVDEKITLLPDYQVGPQASASKPSLPWWIVFALKL